jgi:hypothetical protein
LVYDTNISLLKPKGYICTTDFKRRIEINIEIIHEDVWGSGDTAPYVFEKIQINGDLYVPTSLFLESLSSSMGSRFYPKTYFDVVDERTVCFVKEPNFSTNSGRRLGPPDLGT